MAEEANNDQESTTTSADEQAQSQQPSKSEPFITLPFDEELSFQSPQKLLDWVTEDQRKFEPFHQKNLSFKNNSDVEGNTTKQLKDIFGMVWWYETWYRNALEISDDLCSLQKSTPTITTASILADKKGLLLKYWTEFTNEGLVPMQSSIGCCALAMSNVKEDNPENLAQAPMDLPKQGIAWLFAMTVLRKQQAEQKLTATQLRSLNDDIKEAQGQVDEYRTKLEAFQKDALKSAALKSPANALGKLEWAHLKAAGLWFLLAIIVGYAWYYFIFCYYVPNKIEPLLADSTTTPFTIGMMGLIGLIPTGIVLTCIIIFLRFGIARINFSVAAGERKAMAMAFRALLIQNAIPNDQQMLFLQNIVGSKLPDYVNCNDIRIPIEELAKLAQAVPKGKKD